MFSHKWEIPTKFVAQYFSWYQEPMNTKKYENSIW
jgi:hypothetical protein